MGVERWAAKLRSATGGSRGDDDLVEAHEINVTPFIDVMLVLLIIFMVAAPLATVDLGVDLPGQRRRAAAAAGQAGVRHGEAGSLGRGRRGRHRARYADVGTRRRHARARRTSASILRADKAVSYGDLMEVMNLLRNAGYLKIALVGLDGRKLTAMNAFALHDVPTDAVCPALGRVGGRDPGRACGADRAGDELVHPAAAARRRGAGDHGRPGADHVSAGGGADGPAAGTGDAAGGCRRRPSQRPRRPCRSRSRRRPPQEKPEVVAPPEQKQQVDAGEARARQGRPRAQADAGQAEGGPPGRKEAVRGAAGAAHQRAEPVPNARRRRRPRSAPALRHRRWPPTTRVSARI